MPISNVNEDGMWIKTAPNGEKFYKGHPYFFKGQFWTYAGDFKSSSEVPVHEACCYTIGDEIKIHRGIPVIPPTNKEKVKRKRVDDCRPINTEIDDKDNVLMVKCKTILEEKGITRGEFKQLYDDDSDFNNSLRTIENSGSLSWSRFTDVMDRTDVDVEIVCRDRKTRKIIGIQKENPPKKKK